jgi:hypothetical protein
MAIDVNRAIYGRKYSAQNEDCNCINDRFHGQSNTVYAMPDSIGEFEMRSSNHPVSLRISRIGSDHRCQLLFVGQDGVMFHELSMQFKRNGFLWSYHFKTKDGKDLTAIQVNVVEGSVVRMPVSGPGSTLRPNWEERWNNCMRARAEQVFGPEAEGIGEFFWGEGLGPGASVLGWALDCAYRATFY